MLSTFLFAGAIPAAASGIALLALHLLPWDFARRSATPAAFVGGFVLGYWLLGSGPLAPESHWHWLPFAALVALGAAPISAVDGVTWLDRLLLYLWLSLVAAWFLVPTWELTPPRWLHVCIWASYTTLLASLLEPLAHRFRGSFLPIVLTATLACTSLVLALAEILRFALFAGAAASAMFGIALLGLFLGKSRILRGIAAPFAVVTAGAMLIGQTNSFSSVPLASYAIVPLAPLSLWLCTLGPLERLTGWKRWFVYISLPATVLATGVALAVAFGVDFSAG